MKKILVPLLLGLTAILSSCQRDDTTPVNPSTSSITGLLGSGTGTGTVELKGKNGTLSKADVDAGGNFVLTLPSGAALAADMVPAASALASLGCTGTLGTSETSARAVGFATLDATRSGNQFQVMSGSASINTTLSAGVRLWVYVDKATTISGSADCTALLNSNKYIKAVTVEVNAPLNAGWNALNLIGTTPGLVPPYTISGTIVTIPDVSSKWLSSTDLIKTMIPGM